jgi:Ca2+-binding RTX toxin-like protein
MVGIENIIGSAHNDWLIGNDGVNRIEGGAGNDHIEGRAGDDVLAGGAGADWLDGGDGIDTADYSAFSGAVRVSLIAQVGYGADAENDRLVNVENIIGSAHDDTLIGDGGDNRFEGGAGADTIEGGGGGIDTAAYTRSNAGVVVDLTAATGKGGDAEGDRLASIENLVGSDHADVLTGDGGANRIDGGAGGRPHRGSRRQRRADRRCGQ